MLKPEMGNLVNRKLVKNIKWDVEDTMSNELEWCGYLKLTDLECVSVSIIRKYES